MIRERALFDTSDLAAEAQADVCAKLERGLAELCNRPVMNSV